MSYRKLQQQLRAFGYKGSLNKSKYLLKQQYCDRLAAPTQWIKGKRYTKVKHLGDTLFLYQDDQGNQYEMNLPLNVRWIDV